jgi:hypothetical protein
LDLDRLDVAPAAWRWTHRCSVLGTIVLLAASLTAPAAADEPQSLSSASATIGSHVPTDGMLTSRDARRLKRVAAVKRERTNQEASADTSSVWLFDYLSRMLDTEPAAARRPRRVTRVAVAAPVQANTLAPIAASVPPSRPAAPANPVKQAAVAAPATGVSPAVSPVVTGTIAPGRPATPTSPESQDALIVAAERSQARLDMVKLEFASRTYDERKLSGQQVFDLRSDWRVLERAREALTSAELTSATAAGFEANAYINETTHTIVVAVAGSQDVRRDFITADVWKALIKAEAPQQFYLAKTYVRSVMQRYQTQGYSTECVGHSLGGGACAYAASELGVRALVLNPISAGKLAAPARFLVTNYIVDGDIAQLIYGARGNEFPGNIQVINDGRDVARLMALEKYGPLAGPLLVVRELNASIKSHKVDAALDLIATQAETPRPR